MGLPVDTTYSATYGITARLVSTGHRERDFMLICHVTKGFPLAVVERTVDNMVFDRFWLPAPVAQWVASAANSVEMLVQAAVARSQSKNHRVISA